MTTLIMMGEMGWLNDGHYMLFGALMFTTLVVCAVIVGVDWLWTKLGRKK